MLGVILVGKLQVFQRTRRIVTCQAGICSILEQVWLLGPKNKGLGGHASHLVHSPASAHLSNHVHESVVGLVLSTGLREHLRDANAEGQIPRTQLLELEGIVRCHARVLVGQPIDSDHEVLLRFSRKTRIQVGIRELSHALHVLGGDFHQLLVHRQGSAVVAILGVEANQFLVVLFRVVRASGALVEIRQLLPHAAVPNILLENLLVDANGLVELSLLQEPLRLLFFSLPIQCHCRSPIPAPRANLPTSGYGSVPHERPPRPTGLDGGARWCGYLPPRTRAEHGPCGGWQRPGSRHAR